MKQYVRLMIRSIITMGEPVITMCFFIKGEESAAIPLRLKAKNKQQTQLDIKEAAIKKGCDGYILVVDSNIIRYKKQIIKSGDCIVRILYTPKKKITEIVWYDNGRIISKERHEGRSLIIDAWDAWK